MLAWMAALVVSGFGWGQETTEPADWIFEGHVFTGDPDRPWVEAVAIRGPRVVAVGTRAALAEFEGSETRRVVTTGTVMAGFNDAHAHWSVASALPLEIDLTAARSLADLRRIVADYARDHPEDAVLEGGHWDLADFPDHRLPTAADLDDLVPDRPVVLWSDGPHAIWANSRAMELAGIDAASRLSSAVWVERDAEGRPTGLFRGRALLGLFRFTGGPRLADLRPRLEAGLIHARQAGVTSVHESVSPLVLPTLAELHDAGDLTLRVHVWSILEGGPFVQRASEDSWRAGFLTGGTRKGGLDGMPGLRTAALLEPYADGRGHTGFRSTTVERLTRSVLTAYRAGDTVALHAAGDGAVRDALEALSRAADEVAPPRPPRIEHAFFVAPQDVEWFAETAIVSVQPAFLSQELDRGEVYRRRLGEERDEHVLPLRSLLDAGATLALGTDHSLTPLEPKYALYAATTRRGFERPELQQGPDQRITLEEALRAYTHGSALAEGQGHEKGLLAPGYLADLVILSLDLSTLDAEDLLELEVDATLVGGRVVFDRSGVTQRESGAPR